MDAIKYHRRSIRLANYDYGLPGAYFVTVCAAQKRCVFGSIENGIMRLNPYGRIVSECWLAMPEHAGQVVLDEYVVMPNHFHAIVVITPNVGAQHAAPLLQADPAAAAINVAPQSLGAIIRSFKSAVTRRINLHRAAHNLSPVHPWQRNYYECIIREEKELQETRHYIFENAANWLADSENPRP